VINGAIVAELVCFWVVSAIDELDAVDKETRFFAKNWGGSH
jgi:hypothetical protein